MMKKILYLAISFCFLSGCFTYSEDSSYTPINYDDGIFQFSYDGVPYRQWTQFHSSAFAMCHSNLDTLIIIGGVSPKREKAIINKVVLVVPIKDISADNTITITKESIVLVFGREKTEEGVLCTWNEYRNADRATICFDDCIDDKYENIYISGSFIVEGPEWQGKQVTLTDGVFKFWVIKDDRCFGDSSDPLGYNAIWIDKN